MTEHREREEIMQPRRENAMRDPRPYVPATQRMETLNTAARQAAEILAQALDKTR